MTGFSGAEIAYGKVGDLYRLYVSDHPRHHRHQGPIEGKLLIQRQIALTEMLTGLIQPFGYPRRQAGRGKVALWV